MKKLLKESLEEFSNDSVKELSNSWKDVWKVFGWILAQIPGGVSAETLWKIPDEILSGIPGEI